MTADTSIMGGIGRAMGDAAQGAMLGHTIGQLRDEVDQANAVANDWHNYAKRLELKVVQLQATVQSVASTAKEGNAEIADLKIKLIRTNEKLAKSDLNKRNYSLLADANEAYGKQFRYRLGQMEKGLRHSGAKLEAVGSVLTAYKELVERMNLTNELPDDLKEKAERIETKFRSGQDLTADDEIRAIIDEAPVPKRPSGATF